MQGVLAVLAVLVALAKLALAVLAERAPGVKTSPRPPSVGGGMGAERERARRK